MMWFHSTMLIKLLLRNQADGASSDDPLEHVMDVLTNATHMPLGRQVMLDQGHLGAIAAQLAANHSDVRRRGAAALLRNMCLGITVCGMWLHARMIPWCCSLPSM